MTNEMWAAGKLQAGHTLDLVLGGTLPDRVECGACNMSAGASLGNRLRGYKSKGGRAPARLTRRSRDW